MLHEFVCSDHGCYGCQCGVTFIQSDFHTNLSTLQWVTNGYTLMVASLLLLSGSTADRIGRKRVLQLGLACFGLASFLCGISQTPGQLIAFRMLQGIGGCMLNPVAMSIITQVFTEKLERAKAIGLWGSVTGISLGMGPIIGGLIVSYFSWRYVFCKSYRSLLRQSSLHKSLYLSQK